MTEKIPEIKPGQPGYLLQTINIMLYGKGTNIKQEIKLPEIEIDLEFLLLDEEPNESDEQV